MCSVPGVRPDHFFVAYKIGSGREIRQTFVSAPGGVWRMSEDEIYLQVGEILLGTTPHSAVEVIVEVEISPEDDHCQLLFDYIDEQGKKDWFSPNGGHVDVGLLKSLVELRKIYKESGGGAGLPVWSGCTITMNVMTVKLAIAFKYG